MPQDRKKALLKKLYYNNYPIMVRYGIKLVGDHSLVKDTIQSMFLRFFEKDLDLLDHPAADAYIIKSFRRDLIRAKNSNSKNEMYSEIPVLYAQEDVLLEKEESENRHQKLLEILNSLSDRQREIIWLHYFEDKAYREIADILDVNYQSVLNNLQRAFRKIRTEFPQGIDRE